MGPDALPMLKLLIEDTSGKLGDINSLANDGTFVGTWLGMQDAIQTTTEGLFNDQLALWGSQGEQLINALINGMQSNESRLYSYLRNILNKMIDELVGGFGGGGGGRVEAMRTVPTTLKPQPTTPPVTITVNAMEDESLQSTLSRVSFQLRNLYE